MAGLNKVLLIGGVIALAFILKSYSERGYSEETAEEIRAKAHLGEYFPPPFKVQREIEEREPSKRKPGVLSQHYIGSYTIQTKENLKARTCSIRVYQNLEGGRRKVVGIWSGELAICQKKTEEIKQVIREIRARPQFEI